MEILTEELLEKISAAEDPACFLELGLDAVCDLSAYLNGKLEEKGLRRIDVIRAAHLNETFGYQIFTGARGASRDKALAIGFALGLDVHDLRALLRNAGASDLYSKNRRDAIIIFCASHAYSLNQADEALFEFGEETISDGSAS